MTTNTALTDIAAVLRRDVIEMTTAAGSGHPTSCLSAAELFSVLFFDEMTYDTDNAFNPGNDQFVLSKGHAAPIWYAALERAGAIDEDLTSLRELDSHLQGHPMPISLDWVDVATGSLGQGLSIAVGKALAAKKQNRTYHTYAMLGDSETAEGQVYEAMQLGSFYNLDTLTAVIDVNRLGQRGETMLGHNVETYRDRFTAFGWDASVINGHNLDEIKDAFQQAKETEKPTAIIAKTVKGKGVSIAEDKNGWHGTALSDQEKEQAFNELPEPAFPDTSIETPAEANEPSFRDETVDWQTYELGEELATRDAYGNALADLAAAKGDVLAVDAEVSNSTRAEYVKEDTPNQFVECFIAEQNMVSMSQGLSVKGYTPYTSTFSAFISRAHDQIRMAALSGADLTFVGSHAGVSIGEDGASQMGLSDIALFRALRDSQVLYPSDGNATQQLVEQTYRSNKLDYIRTTRPETPVIYDNDEAFPIGDFKVVEQPADPDIVLAGAGITVHEALEAKELLKDDGIDAAVVDIYSVKPFKAKKFRKFVEENSNRLVVSEDHYPEGGVGEMLGNQLEASGIEMRTLAIESIPHSGKKQELLHKCRIGRHGIEETARTLIDQDTKENQ